MVKAVINEDGNMARWKSFRVQDTPVSTRPLLKPCGKQPRSIYHVH